MERFTRMSNNMVPITSRLSTPAWLMIPMLVCLVASTTVNAAADPLPSWNAGQTRTVITEFVESVADEKSPSYLPPNERIAVFDNDGTLWSEQPMYFQLIFALERIRELAPANPQWKTQEPFASVLKGDISGALAGGEAAILKLVMATHADMTTDEFEQEVSKFLETAKHPTTGKKYTEMVYQPMLELLDYLRSNGFKTFIVSGGGIEFMRPWVEQAYGIPPEQVVGSSILTKYEVRDGVPVLVRLPEINFIDDRAGKPVGINQHIGRRPVIAVGNSDGDFQMLEWSTAGDGPRLGMLIHHTDGEREWAYDRKSHIGKLARGIDESEARGWAIVDMKEDWKVIFPPQ